MTRLRSLVLVVAFFLVAAIPAVAQQDSNSNTEGQGPIVSVTLVPFVGIRGATYDFGIVTNEVRKSMGDPRTGNLTTSSVVAEDRLSVDQNSRPMVIFAAETGRRKGGIGFGGSGWAYSSTGSTNGSVGEGGIFHFMGRSTSGDQQDYEGSSSWNIRSIDGGLLWYNTRAKVTTKVFLGGEFAEVSNETSVAVSTESNDFFLDYDNTGHFYHDEGTMESSSKVNFSGFGPTVGFMTDVNLGRRITIKNSTKGSLLLGKERESGEYDFQSNFYSYDTDNSDPRLRKNGFSSPYNAALPTTVMKIQEELSVQVKLGNFQVGGGLFIAIFHGATAAPQNGPTWSRGQGTNLVLAGGTTSVTYRW